MSEIDLHKTNFVVCSLEADDAARTETYPLTADGLSPLRPATRRRRRGGGRSDAEHLLLFFRTFDDQISGSLLLQQ
jgi:hypothetical protein